jgi:hypothetical protein
MFVAQEDEIIAWLYDCEMLQATPLITFVLADLSTSRPIAGLIGERATTRGLHAFMEHAVPRAYPKRNQAADRPAC